MQDSVTKRYLISVSLILAFLSSHTTLSDEVVSIDPSLASASSYGPIRFLVFQRCSPEHCYSEGHFEWLDVSSSPPEIAESTPIAELSVGWSVDDFEWAESDGRTFLEVEVSAKAYGYDKSEVITFDLSRFGEYRVFPKVPTGDWRAASATAGNVTALSQAEADDIIGTNLRLSGNSISSNLNGPDASVCDSPVYRRQSMNERQFIDWFKVWFEEIGTCEKSVDVFEVQCGDRAWLEFGNVFVVTQHNQMFVAWNGYLFEMASTP